MDAGPRAGLFVSLRRLFGSAAELAQVRLELFAIELQQEKLRALEALTWLAGALVAAGVALVLFDVLVLLLVAEPYRLVALAALVVLHVGAALAAWRIARARLSEGTPFEGSVAELRRDRAAVTGRSDNPPMPR